jgi:hypothetical protein
MTRVATALSLSTIALLLAAAGCGSTAKPIADTCGKYVVPANELARREEDRPAGSPDLTFTDKGQSVLLIEGQSCIDETGKPDSVTDGEVYRDTSPPAKAATTAPPAKVATAPKSEEATTAEQKAMNEPAAPTAKAPTTSCASPYRPEEQKQCEAVADGTKPPATPQSCHYKYDEAAGYGCSEVDPAPPPEEPAG